MNKTPDVKVQLRYLQLTSGIVFVVLAIAAGLLMNHMTYQISIGYLAKNELASRTSTVFVPALRPIFDIELRWIVVFVLALSALLPLVYVLWWQKRYQKSLVARSWSWRWLDAAVTSALLMEVVALLSGVQDIMLIKLVGGLTAISAVLGWLVERQSTGRGKGGHALSVLAVVCAALPWLVVAVYAISTPVWGMIRSSWFVYGLYLVLGLAAVTWWLNFWYGQTKFRRWKDYAFVERNYVIINGLAKVAFAVILIVGLWRL